MASGRLGSATVPPYNATLLYSNTSAVPASVNIQATVLSATANSNIALAVDSATVSLNQTTTATTISSGNITNFMYWLDPTYSTTPLQFDQVTTSYSGNTGEFPVSYWNGSAWTKPSTGFYGSPDWHKIDPYFLSNPSAYGKSAATMIVPHFYTSNAQQQFSLFGNIASFTALQFATLQQGRNPGVTPSSYLQGGYSGVGEDGDHYTSTYAIGVDQNSYMSVFNPGAGSYTSRSTDGIFYNLMGGNNITNYNHWWFAPRVMGANGLWLVQTSGYTQGYFVICDPALGASLGNTNYAVYWSGSAATAAWYYMYGGASSDRQVEWFDYNPNTGRYYICSGVSGNRSVYSFTKASLDALTVRGTSGSYGYSSSWMTNHGMVPWSASNAMRPLRLDSSLWWTTAANGNSYYSTDLATWTLASTYNTSSSFPSSYLVVPKTTSSYLYATIGSNNIQLFSSNFGNVSTNSRLEFNTSFNNYQRTGIVISPGDKIYGQNLGGTSFSLTAMGYEGS